MPASEEAKDLGIIHNPGQKRKRGLRDARALKTIPVWNKIAGLSIPKAKRRLMAASAGAAKACYGATVNRTTQDGRTTTQHLGQKPSGRCMARPGPGGHPNRPGEALYDDS